LHDLYLAFGLMALTNELLELDKWDLLLRS